jgi:hypothetical protein
VDVTYVTDVFFCELAQSLQTDFFIEKGEVIPNKFVEITCANVKILITLKDGIALKDRHNFDTAAAC